MPTGNNFRRAGAAEFDRVVAIYRDQGHIAAKIPGFSAALNITAGLPIIRTSVNHGTAFDLVAKNRAEASNTRLAVWLARQLTAARA